jgi:hypothetical protein
MQLFTSAGLFRIDHFSKGIIPKAKKGPKGIARRQMSCVSWIKDPTGDRRVTASFSGAKD